MALDFEVRREDDARIELTPLIDVIFQLLVFFMLSSTFLFPDLDLELPELKTESDAPSPPPLVVNMDAAGNLFVNSDPVPLEGLGQALSMALEGAEERTVFFRGDKGLSYGQVIEVMREAASAGAVQINFLYEASP